MRNDKHPDPHQIYFRKIIPIVLAVPVHIPVKAVTISNIVDLVVRGANPLHLLKVDT